MSKMDKLGYDRMTDPKAAFKIKRAMRQIRAELKKGATIPEVVWEFFAIFQVAIDNVRFALVQDEVKRKKVRRHAAQQKR